MNGKDEERNQRLDLGHAEEKDHEDRKSGDDEETKQTVGDRCDYREI